MISVVIPLYNKEKTVARALRSVLNQTYQDFEILVVNDGSTDGSAAEVQRFADSRLRLIHQPNGGVSAARNRGIAEAKAEWVAFLDADDEWLPGFLTKIDGLYSDFPQAGVCATRYEYVTSSGISRPIVLRGLPVRFSRGVLQNYFALAAQSDPPVFSSAVAARKQSLLRVGGFPTGITSGEDLLTWAKLAMANSFAYDVSTLARFFLPESVQDRPFRFTGCEDRVTGELLQLRQGVHSQQRADFDNYLGMWMEMRASILLELGFGTAALFAATRSLRYRGLNLKAAGFIFLSAVPRKVRGRLLPGLRRLHRRITR